MLTKKLWELYTDNHPVIHTNRFGSYDSLSEDQRNTGIATMVAELVRWGIPIEKIDEAIRG